MASLDDIVRERQRISERLAHLDEERAKLRDELAELDAAERVLVRLSGPSQPGPAEAGRAATPPRRRRQPRAPSRRTTKSDVPSLGDATLQAVDALGGGVSAAEVREYLEREFGMQVRANHLGMALQRHRRAGRLEQNDTHWSMPGAPRGR